MSTTDTRRMLAESIERILRDHCSGDVVRAADLRSAHAKPDAAEPLVRALEGAGLDAAVVASDQGGAGLGWADVRALLEACGHWAAPVALPETFAAQALARIAGATLQPGWATLAAGRFEGTSFVASGVARWPQTSVLVVSVPEPGDSEAFAIWSFPARFTAGKAGASGAAGAPGANIAGEPRGQVTLDPAEGERLGTATGGIGALQVGAAVRCAQIAGACARVVAMAAGYARDRVQFGRPIAAFQAIQQQLALAQQWASMAGAASALVLSDEGVALDPVRVASARRVCCEAAQVCARVAHAVHGAIGVTAEYDLQLFTRRLWSWSEEFGSQTYWTSWLGARLLASDASSSWDQVVRHTGG